MSVITVKHDSKQINVNVDDISEMKRVILANRAPADLEEFAEYDSAEDVKNNNDVPEISEDVIEYFRLITRKVTDFDDKQLQEMKFDLFIKISASVLNEVFSDEESDDCSKGRKRVVCSKEFFETVFTKDVGVVSGMPGDAEFVDFEYYPSSESFGLLFESDEWDVVSCIPEHEVVAIGDDVDGVSWVSGY